MQKLLIADHSEAFTLALEKTFRGEFDIRTCRNGNEATQLLLSFRPDALILNLMLPVKDGLTILQTSSYVPPVVLGITPYANAYIERAAIAAGIGFLLISPCIQAVRVRLMDLIHQTRTTPKHANPQTETAIHLHVLNFPTHRDGYQQLCICIPMFAQNPNQRLTKELYPTVAKLCGCHDSRSVEHSIRLAITDAWLSRDDQIWAKYFPPAADGSIPCPSNKAFISRLAELIKT